MGYEGTQAWNEAHAAARSQQPFAAVWQGFHDASQSLESLLHDWKQEELSSSMENPWGRSNPATVGSVPSWLTSGRTPCTCVKNF